MPKDKNSGLANESASERQREREDDRNAEPSTSSSTSTSGIGTPSSMFHAAAPARSAAIPPINVSLSYPNNFRPGLAFRTAQMPRIVFTDNRFLLGAGINLSGANEVELGRALQRSGELSSIVLCNCIINAEGITEIALALENMPFLVNLDLTGCNIGDQEAEIIAEALPNSSLFSLRLACNRISSRGIRAILDALVNNENLAILDLTNSDIDANEESSLRQVFAETRNTTSDTLLLSGKTGRTDAPSSSTQQPGTLNSTSAMRVLDGKFLVSTNIDLSGARGAQMIEIALRNNPNLSSIVLCNCMIDNEGAAKIAQTLPHLKFLTNLNLTKNNLKDGGAGIIAGALLSSSLVSLHLADNKIEDRGCIAIANALRRGGSQRLTLLDLTDNNIGDQGARALNQMLNQNQGSNLSQLVLTGNDIHFEAARELRITMNQESSRLTNLYLADNPCVEEENEYDESQSEGEDEEDIQSTQPPSKRTEP